MSILQLWVEADHARVAVDTLGYSSVDGQCREVSKLLVLPHAGVVLAYRESDVGFFNVFAQVMLGQGNADFDSIDAAMPTHVRNAATQVPARTPASLVTAEIYLVGYSPSAGRMRAISFRVDLKAPKLEAAPLEGLCWVGPLIPGFRRELNDDAGMLETAAMQLQWMRENTPTRVTGGRLMVAEIRRGSIETRDVGSI